MKSCPGLAVPDSVHQVNVAAPCRLPRRRTMMRAAGSVSGTSMVSAASSTRDRGSGPTAAPSAEDEAKAGALGAGAARGGLSAAARSLAGLGGGELEVGAACGAGELGGSAGRSAGGAAALGVGAEGCANAEGCADAAGCVDAVGGVVAEDCADAERCVPARERSARGIGASVRGSESFTGVGSRLLSPPK